MSNSESRKQAAAERRKKIEEKATGFQPGNSSPRFVADVMLGRLAKWLRIGGFDVLYSNSYSDDELVRLSNGEGRVLLSRDTRLLIRKSVHGFIFLESQDLYTQLRQVFKAMHIDALSSPLTRCLQCNEKLRDAGRESVRGLVPAFVYETQERFKSCSSCGKIFWAGTHRTSIIRSLEKLAKAQTG